jgi:hypothetical protein
VRRRNSQVKAEMIARAQSKPKPPRSRRKARKARIPRGMRISFTDIPMDATASRAGSTVEASRGRLSAR